MAHTNSVMTHTYTHTSRVPHESVRVCERGRVMYGRVMAYKWMNHCAHLHPNISIATYIFIYIYTRLYMCMKYIHICTYIHTHTYKHTLIYIYIYTYAHIHINIHIYMHGYTCIYLCIYICIYIDVHTYMCIYIYVHTYIYKCAITVCRFTSSGRKINRHFRRAHLSYVTHTNETQIRQMRPISHKWDTIETDETPMRRIRHKWDNWDTNETIETQMSGRKINRHFRRAHLSYVTHTNET